MKSGLLAPLSLSLYLCLSLFLSLSHIRLLMPDSIQRVLCPSLWSLPGTPLFPLPMGSLVNCAEGNSMFFLQSSYFSVAIIVAKSQ